jgi:hypothetical protein
VRPVTFPEQNSTLHAPENDTSILPLPVWTDGRSVISCWKMTWKERFTSFFSGRVWLVVLDRTHAPLYVSGLPMFKKGKR